MPISFLNGLNAFNQGEIEIEKSTSGSWLITVFLGFTFREWPGALAPKLIPRW